MREILFRGKRKDNGECIEGYAAQSGGTFIICDNGLTYGGFEVFEVDPATVGQYTGLTDKNGKKIFEGDILDVEPGSNYAYLVVYGLCECSGYGFGIEDVIIDGNNYADYSGEIEPLHIFLEEHVPMMVIGNVHDMPEVESCRYRYWNRDGKDFLEVHG